MRRLDGIVRADVCGVVWRAELRAAGKVEFVEDFFLGGEAEGFGC